MADRTVYGLTNSENGWRMVDQGSCVWVKVPGTDGRVSLQIREGQPATILGAFVADWNAYIEPVRDADSACWTPTNSVASSNHLSGTACDVCWQSHPFQVADAGFNAAQLKTMDEMLDYYEEIVFWGNRWTSPKDSMHVQMNGGTYGSGNVARVQDFINRKIRADGFSTFRRGGTVTPPPPPPPASNAADVLARATGVTAAKAQQILTGVVNGLRDSQCTNVNRIAMWLAQIGHESAGFNATEEYASGAAYEGRSDLGNTQPGDGVRFKGRTWIQITGRSNVTALSKWAFGKGIVPTERYFVDAPEKLAEIQYAGLGPAWYWVVARPQINGLCDARNLTAVTQAINGGQNGATDRKTRYDRALALGDQLLALLSDAPVQGDDDLSAEAERQIGVIYQELTKKFASRSPLRHLGEGAVDTMTGFVLNADGSEHLEICRLLAGYGHPPTLALLREVASADPVKFPDRQGDRLIAQAILADVTSTPVAQAASVAAAPVAAPDTRELADAYAENARLREEISRLRLEASVSAPLATYLPVPAVSTGSTGQLIGDLYNALDALRLADALPIEGRAPLAALVGVLNTKNGSQI